jgi:hypothetical protein
LRISHQNLRTWYSRLGIGWRIWKPFVASSHSFVVSYFPFALSWLLLL